MRVCLLCNNWLRFNLILPTCKDKVMIGVIIIIGRKMLECAWQTANSGKLNVGTSETVHRHRCALVSIYYLFYIYSDSLLSVRISSTRFWDWIVVGPVGSIIMLYLKVNTLDNVERKLTMHCSQNTFYWFLKVEKQFLWIFIIFRKMICKK